MLDRGTRHPHLRAGFDRYEVVATPQRDLGDERVDDHVGDRPNEAMSPIRGRIVAANAPTCS